MIKKVFAVFFIFLLLYPAQSLATVSVADRVIQTAQQHIGTPYQFGAALGDTRSFDCSSFSAYVFGQHGIHLPRVSEDQAKVGTAVTRSNLQKGDLLFYDTNGDGRINHLGIYMSATEMIHASTSVGVHITNPFSSYWSPRFVSARRVIINSATPVPTATGQTYTVKSGDSLSVIARQFNLTVDALKMHNQLTTDLIFIGQQLRIQATNQPTPTPTPTPIPVGSALAHTVISGDTLWAISREYSVTVDDLTSWNQLQSNILRVGQVLQVAPSSMQKVYTVKSGDTLWKIATENRTTVQALSDLNNITNSIIQPGQTLILP